MAYTGTLVVTAVVLIIMTSRLSGDNMPTESDPVQLSQAKYTLAISINYV